VNRSRSSIVGLLTLVAGVSACGGGGENRADVVIPIVADQAPARFDEFAATAGELGAEVTTWCGAADGAGQATIATVEQAQTEWYALKPFWFGPVMDRRSQFIVNFRTDPAGIDELLAAADPVDAATLRDFVGADKRGLEALVYLLGAPADPRRCDYASGIADLVGEEAQAVADEWTTYGPSLVTDEMTANDAIRDIVSNAVFALREIEKDGTPAIESGLLAGARAAVLGEGDATALTTLIDDATVTQLTSEFDAADAASAEQTLATTVVSELGITLNFSDADGDG
jgi:predicted lipoprotein